MRRKIGLLGGPKTDTAARTSPTTKGDGNDVVEGAAKGKAKGKSTKRVRKTATVTANGARDGAEEDGEEVKPKKRAKKTAEKNVVKKSVSPAKVKEESASASDGDNGVAIGRCRETREDEGVGSTGAEYGDEEGEGEEVV